MVQAKIKKKGYKVNDYNRDHCLYLFYRTWHLQMGSQHPDRIIITTIPQRRNQSQNSTNQKFKIFKMDLDSDIISSSESEGNFN